MGGTLTALLGSYAPASGVFELIATASPTSTNEVNFSSIPSDYKYLQIHFVSYSSSDSNFYIRFNGDSGNNYGYHYLYGAANGNTTNGSGILSGGVNMGASSMLLTNQFTTGGSSTLPFMGSVYIGDHASTSKKKTLMANFGRINVADPQARIQNTTAQWNSTSAITSISLFNIGTYTTGSTVTLYGVKN
jgi:hypothetical protein